MNHLRVAFAPYWQSIQHALFPQLERVLGPLTEKQQQLVQTLEVIRIEQMIPRRFRVPGRPPKDRAAMARALVAKAVYDMPTTRVLLDRLDTDVVLRRICGWERRSEVPSVSGPRKLNRKITPETHHELVRPKRDLSKPCAAPVRALGFTMTRASLGRDTVAAQAGRAASA